MMTLNSATHNPKQSVTNTFTVNSLRSALFCFLRSGLIDENWSQAFYNDTDQDQLFYLHYYKEGNITYPNFNELQSKPFFLLIEAHKEGWWTTWPTAFEYGTLGYMYAFSPDTLEKYSWEEILVKKKYWYTARPCQKEPIQFPEEFEYMGDR